MSTNDATLVEETHTSNAEGAVVAPTAGLSTPDHSHLGSLSAESNGSISIPAPDPLLTLGIDVGTTSIKATILSTDSVTHDQFILSYTSLNHHATLTTAPPLHHEQSPSLILQAVVSCIQSLPLSQRQKVMSIGVSCQMHGIVLWKSKIARSSFIQSNTPVSAILPTPSVPSAKNNTPKPQNNTSKNNTKIVDPGSPHSSLVTWQDQRCTPTFLATLNSSSAASSPLFRGYGLSTLNWYAENSPNTLIMYDRAGTIGDYLVWLFTDSNAVYMDVTNAAAWGLFDEKAKSWLFDEIDCLDIHPLLPKVSHTSNAPILTLSHQISSILAIPSTCIVSVCVGDAAASVYALAPVPGEAVLTFGTSMQLSLLQDASPTSADSHENSVAAIDNSVIQRRPYLISPDSQLLVFASLNGGNVISWLAQSLHTIYQDITPTLTPPPIDTIHEKLTYALTTPCSPLPFTPTLYGERGKENLSAILTLTPQPLTLAVLAHTFYTGLFQHLYSLLPPHTRITCILLIAGRKSTQGNGLKHCIEKIFKVEVKERVIRTVKESEGREDNNNNEQDFPSSVVPDAAIGAAMVAVSHARKLKEATAAAEKDRKLQVADPVQATGI